MRTVEDACPYKKLLLRAGASGTSPPTVHWGIGKLILEHHKEERMIKSAVVVFSLQGSNQCSCNQV